MCKTCDWVEYRDKLGTLLDESNGANTPLVNNLATMYDWVVMNRHVTDKQKKIINNLY